jgi:hypothetical protein
MNPMMLQMNGLEMNLKVINGLVLLTKHAAMSSLMDAVM